MQSIANWLKNGTYEQGVALYEQYGGNSFLKQRFAAGAGPFNEKKLRDELEALAEVKGEVDLAKGDTECEPVNAAGQPAPLSEPARSASPQAQAEAKRYLEMVNKRNRLYKQLGMLMEQKHYLPEGDELRICAEKILSTYQRIGELWAETDYYEQNGCFATPDPAAKAAQANTDPKKQMQLLRQSISKAKNRLENPTCRNREQTIKLLNECEAKLAALVAERKARK